MTAPLDAPAAYPSSGVTVPPSNYDPTTGTLINDEKTGAPSPNTAAKPDLQHNSTIPVVEPLPPRDDHPRRMKPYLQLMCVLLTFKSTLSCSVLNETSLTGRTNPMLRYDTIVDGVWHGFAMLVATDEGSDYSIPPFLTYQWDGTAGGLAHIPIHELPRPGADATEPGVETRWAQGLRYYAHNGRAGTHSFWRFKIEIPLGEREEEIFYSVNVRTFGLSLYSTRRRGATLSGSEAVRLPPAYVMSSRVARKTRSGSRLATSSSESCTTPGQFAALRSAPSALSPYLTLSSATAATASRPEWTRRLSTVRIRCGATSCSSTRKSLS